MPPPPRWRASSAPSANTPPTGTRCCASSATTAAPPMARPRGYEQLSIAPVALDLQAVVQPRSRRRREARLGRRPLHGRGIRLPQRARPPSSRPPAPSGLVMDCDTTGVEPDFALVKFKKLAGGGYFKIINRCVPKPCARWATIRGRSTTSSLCGGPRHAAGLETRWPTAPCARAASATSRSPPSRARSNRPSTSASSSTSGRWARNSAPRR